MENLTKEINDTEVLAVYQEKHVELDGQFKDLVGPTVIDTRKLHNYLLNLNQFYMGELTKMKIHISELEKKLERQ